jgi:arabinose-5-phosphate isomerase
MTGGLHSILADAADLVLDIGVPMEACPLGLAPTASTTATLAMGDALAVVLLQKKQFRASDFRKNHPGGSLGERLKVKVQEVMLSGYDVPLVQGEDPAAMAIEVLNEKNLGAVLIMGVGEKILGIVTDGDVRRSVARGKTFTSLRAADIMTANPVAIDGSMLAADALSIMQKHEITVLPIVNDNGSLAGILHLHNLLGKGEFRFLV